MAGQSDALGPIPMCFKCPISLEPLVRPVTTVDGHVYERHHIEEWFRRGNHTSPVTGARLESTAIKDDWALRNAIEEYFKLRRKVLTEKEPPDLAVRRQKEQDTIAQVGAHADVVAKEAISIWAKTLAGALLEPDRILRSVAREVAQGLFSMSALQIEVTTDDGKAVLRDEFPPCALVGTVLRRLSTPGTRATLHSSSGELKPWVSLGSVRRTEAGPMVARWYSVGHRLLPLYAGTPAWSLPAGSRLILWGGVDVRAMAVDQRYGVVSVSGTANSYAALRQDGSVVTWGEPDDGGDSSSVASKLRSGVVNVTSTDYAFAALLADGSVVTWGEAAFGGDSRNVASRLRTGIVSLASTQCAFAALREDGSVVTWGHGASGGDSLAVADELGCGVVSASGTCGAFAALREDGSVVTWGQASCGGHSNSVATELRSGVVSVTGTGSAFAALKEDGSVLAWGVAAAGGCTDAVANELNFGVVSVSGTERAFAALRQDGSVVTWGDSACGGDSSSVAADLRGGVVNISATASSFAALRKDGSVVTWGRAAAGGDSSNLASELSNGIVSVSSTAMGFCAVKLCADNEPEGN